MPWTCPACLQSIINDSRDRLPRPGVVYRCHVCRLDLVVDTKRHKLTVAVDDATRSKKTTRR
jgi:hypothetical protein